MTELKKAHARIAELEAQLESIGAGGVSGPLVRTPTSGAADLPEALYADAVKFAKEKASISYVQRKCRCSYNKAERMLEQMVADGIIQTYNWRKDAALTAQAISEAPDHVADLGNMVERAISAEPAAHVQNPAENEHVADDMSKNEMGSNAPQPAPSADSVLEDAARYRWLRDESWAGYNSGNGTPKVYTIDGAGNRKMQLAEDAMDSAVDAARAAQKEGEKP